MHFNKQKVLRVLSVVVIIIVGFVGMNMLGSTEKESNKREVEPEKRTVQQAQDTANTVAQDGDCICATLPHDCILRLEQSKGRQKKTPAGEELGGRFQFSVNRGGLTLPAPGREGETRRLVTEGRNVDRSNPFG